MTAKDIGSEGQGKKKPTKRQATADEPSLPNVSATSNPAGGGPSDGSSEARFDPEPSIDRASGLSASELTVGQEPALRQKPPPVTGVASDVISKNAFDNEVI